MSKNSTVFKFLNSIKSRTLKPEISYFSLKLMTLEYFMILSQAIKTAKEELYNLGFKESTVERRYGYLWQRMLKTSNANTEVTTETISYHFLQYYKKDFFNIDNCMLTKHERIIKRVFNDLLDFILTNSFKYRPHNMDKGRKYLGKDTKVISRVKILC